MQAKSIFRSVLFLALVVVSSTQSHAAFVLNVHDGSLFAPSVVNVNAGSTVTINFLLTQDGETVLDHAETGLIGADFDATVAGTGITPTSFTINPSFIDANQPLNPTGISGQEVRWNIQDPANLTASGITVSNDTVPLDFDGDSIVLGTATFTIDSSATGSRLVTLAANTDGFGDRFSRANPGGFPVNLAVDSNSFTFNVTAVPEPSSFAALLIFGGVAMTRRRRRS